MPDNDFKSTIKVEQENLNKKFNSLLDTYKKNNSYENREFLCYLSAAIFLIYREKYPQLSKYILFRTKSDMSFIRNVQKEFIKYMTDGKENEDFNMDSIEKDLSGIRLVLNNINFSLPETDESRELFNDPKIKELQKQYRENLDFADKVDDYINASVYSGKEYYKLKIELLKRIIDITPPAFTKETFPNPSLLYETAKTEYNYYLENDNFPTTITSYEKEELKDLLNKLRSKVGNNLHFEILHQTTFKIEPGKEENGGEVQKENGFQSIYYTLFTPFGKIELQSQSNRAYYLSTKGNAYHSGIPGKTFPVRDFFELVDPNDDQPLKYYLDTLDSISADTMVGESELPTFETEKDKQDYLSTTPHGIAYQNSQDYRKMLTHIKIKDKMQVLPSYLPNSVYDFDKNQPIQPRYKMNINNKKLQDAINAEPQEVKLSTIDSNLYLLSTALSVSPYMNVASSGHSSFTTVAIHNKKVIGEFSETIRNKDTNTLLRDVLIRRLEDIIESPTKYFSNIEDSLDIQLYLKIIQDHEEIANKLPKDISKKNIVHYGNKLEQLRNKSNDNSNDIQH